MSESVYERAFNDGLRPDKQPAADAGDKAGTNVHKNQKGEDDHV